jgi:hypothetical protein
MELEGSLTWSRQPLLGLILTKSNPAYMFTTYTVIIRFNTSFQSTHRSRKRSFSDFYLMCVLITRVSHAYYLLHQSVPLPLDVITQIKFGEDYKWWRCFSLLLLALSYSQLFSSATGSQTPLYTSIFFLLGHRPSLSPIIHFNSSL